MNQDNQDFDPQQILYEHQQFFEANKNSFSPAPKRFLTPNQSDEKLTYKHGSVDQRDSQSLLASGQNAQEQIDNYQQQHQQSIGQSSPDGKNKELLIMTIEIGDGNRDTLRVFEDDDPYELAQKFCQIHQLNPQIVEPLAHNIYANIEKVLEERTQGTTGTETTRVQENEPQDQGQVSGNQSIVGQDYRQIMQQNEFKDMGVRTGEFRSIKDDQGQHHNDSDSYQQQFGGMQEYRADKRQKNKEQQQQQQIYNYVDEEESAQQNEWGPAAAAPLKASKSNKEFGIRASYDHQQHQNSKKSRNPQQEGDYADYNAQNEDQNRKWTNKSTEASHRQSHVEYPSDRRAPQLGNAYPDNFQNEEEYLEHLIMSQYGNNSYERGASFMKNHYNNGKNSELTFTPQINRSSKVMLENKYQNNRMNVYDRLHNHSKIRNQKMMNKSTHSPRKSVGSVGRKSATSFQNQEINYGSLLYHRGMKRKEEVNKMLQDVKKEMIYNEERECTFQPAINQISAEIVNSKSKGERAEDSLINFGLAKHEKIERAREMRKSKELEGCTFKPAINRLSAKMVYEKEAITQDPIGDRFTKLFYDHRARQEHREYKASQMHEECTFTPAINTFSHDLADQTNFEKRSRRFSAKINRLENLRRQKEEAELYDAQTGQPFFRPSVGRPPREGSRERNAPIGDYLYNRRFEKENIQRDLFEKEQRTMEANMVRSSEKSQIIMGQIQRKRLQEIFNCFDSDEDGYISSSKIDITSVGTDVLEAFAPLLCEMEELNQTLNLFEFVEAAEKLLKTLPVHERDNLVLPRKTERKSAAPEYSFHPEINQRSAKMAQNLRPYGNFEALYEQYIQEKKAQEDKIKFEQNKKIEKELKECPFKPTLMADANMPLFSMDNLNYYFVDQLM